MNSVPSELIDAAKIDGAGEFRTLFKVVLPMSKAILAVIGLFYAVGYWNTYFLSVLYTPGLETKPIQVLIQQRPPIAATQPTGQDAAAAAAHSPRGWRNRPGRIAQDGRGRVHDGPDRDHVPVHPEALHEGGHHRSHQGLTRRSTGAGSRSASVSRGRRRRLRRCRARPPGVKVQPPNAKGTSRSPAPVLVLLRGLDPNGFDAEVDLSRERPRRGRRR